MQKKPVSHRLDLAVVFAVAAVAVAVVVMAALNRCPRGGTVVGKTGRVDGINSGGWKIVPCRKLLLKA